MAIAKMVAQITNLSFGPPTFLGVKCETSGMDPEQDLMQVNKMVFPGSTKDHHVIKIRSGKLGTSLQSSIHKPLKSGRGSMESE